MTHTLYHYSIKEQCCFLRSPVVNEGKMIFPFLRSVLWVTFSIVTLLSTGRPCMISC